AGAAAVPEWGVGPAWADHAAWSGAVAKALGRVRLVLVALQRLGAVGVPAPQSGQGPQEAGDRGAGAEDPGALLGDVARRDRLARAGGAGGAGLSRGPTSVRSSNLIDAGGRPIRPPGPTGPVTRARSFVDPTRRRLGEDVRTNGPRGVSGLVGGPAAIPEGAGHNSNRAALPQ